MGGKEIGARVYARYYNREHEYLGAFIDQREIARCKSNDQGCGQSLIDTKGSCKEEVEYIFNLDEHGGARRVNHPLCKLHADEAMKSGAELIQTPG
jgi:hypothetical protein